jgi:hypothetical protein
MAPLAPGRPPDFLEDSAGSRERLDAGAARDYSSIIHTAFLPECCGRRIGGFDEIAG